MAAVQRRTGPYNVGYFGFDLKGNIPVLPILNITLKAPWYTGMKVNFIKHHVGYFGFDLKGYYNEGHRYMNITQQFIRRCCHNYQFILICGLSLY
jgi:hypothetical protein